MDTDSGDIASQSIAWNHSLIGDREQRARNQAVPLFHPCLSAFIRGSIACLRFSVPALRRRLFADPKRRN